MTADQYRDIRRAVERGERNRQLEGYYRSYPGDRGIRHHMTIRDYQGFKHDLTCNSRAMWILADTILAYERITYGLIMALRYVR